MEFFLSVLLSIFLQGSYLKDTFIPDILKKNVFKEMHSLSSKRVLNLKIYIIIFLEKYYSKDFKTY